MASRATSVSSARQAASPSQSGGPGKVVKGSPLERRGEVLVDLVEGPLDVDPGRGPPGFEAGPEPVDAWPSSVGICRWRSSSARADSGVGAWIWGATTNSSAWNAGVLVVAQLGLPDVDGLHGLGQLRPAAAAG